MIIHRSCEFVNGVANKVPFRPLGFAGVVRQGAMMGRGRNTRSLAVKNEIIGEESVADSLSTDHTLDSLTKVRHTPVRNNWLMRLARELLYISWINWEGFVFSLGL